jgi:hypothetical protein
LLSSQTNYTLTNLAEHLQVFSHDTINRYLRGEKLTPRLLWDNVEHLIQLDENGSIVFDDTVIDKNCSNSIELVRRQYSGTEHRVIRSIGLIRACCTKPKPLAINSLSGIDSCSAPRKSGKIRQNPSTPAQVDVPKS